MKIVTLKNRNRVSEIVEVHMQSFTGFFLTFLGRGFLKQLYKGFIEYDGSGIITAINSEGEIVGFLAYSNDLSGFYKHLIKKYLFHFFLYASISFFKKPKHFFRLFRALKYAGEAKRDEKYIELSSIGVLPEAEGSGIGSMLINELKKNTDFKKYSYIKLETDASNNEKTNKFYQKNGFILDHEYKTSEGRKMNEYRWYI